MTTDDLHALGYTSVDDGANVPFLIDTMDMVSRWAATRELRAWERDRLALLGGERLLDVGCGLGDAALALARELGPDGELVGIDVSASMIDAARRRGEAAPCATRFAVGDGRHLDEPDASFDAVRAERMLQWVDDPGAVVAEVARVLRPGGRVTLIDTDWSTLHLDVDDPWVTTVVADAMALERDRPSHIGRRLGLLALEAGLVDLEATSATHVWSAWDPDLDPAPDGCFSMRSFADDLVAAGQLDDGAARRFVATIDDAARRGRFTMTLTMHAIAARRV